MDWGVNPWTCECIHGFVSAPVGCLSLQESQGSIQGEAHPWEDQGEPFPLTPPKLPGHGSGAVGLTPSRCNPEVEQESQTPAELELSLPPFFSPTPVV